MDRNNKSFQTPLHEYLWREYVFAIPLEISTDGIKDNELLESCEQFYHYIMDTYDDILENPQEYGFIPSDQIYDFASMKQMLARINFHKDIMTSLIEIAIVTQNDFLSLKTQDYDKWIKNLKNRKYNKIRLFENITFFDKLWCSLERIGMVFHRNETEILITNVKYPKMFLAARLLIEADKARNNKTARSSQWYINLDFRAINDPLQKPDEKDVFYPMTDNEKRTAYGITTFIENNKKTRKSYTNLCGVRTIDYKLHRQFFFSLGWVYERGVLLTIRLPEPETEAHNMFLEKINLLENGEKIKDHFFNNLILCRFCNKNCIKQNAYKKNWIFLGRPIGKLIKTCFGLKFHYPLDKKQLPMLKTVLGILMEVY